MPIEDLKKIAEGRVWTGSNGERTETCRRAGQSPDSTEAASQHAKIENYNVVAYPKPEDFLTTLMKTRKGQIISKARLKQHWVISARFHLIEKSE